MFNIWLEMQKTVSMFWAMYKWKIMLTYCTSYNGFRKKSTGWYYKVVSRTTATYKVEQCVKYDEIWAFSNAQGYDQKHKRFRTNNFVLVHALRNVMSQRTPMREISSNTDFL